VHRAQAESGKAPRRHHKSLMVILLLQTAACHRGQVRRWIVGYSSPPQMQYNLPSQSSEPMPAGIARAQLFFAGPARSSLGNDFSDPLEAVASY
jgi:hypothetical protein